MDKNIVKELQTGFNGFFKEDRHYNVIKMRAEGKTLAEIGDSEGATKERIRQMEQHSSKRIARFLHQNEVDIASIICEDNIVNEDKANKFFGDNLWMVIKYVIRSSKNLIIGDWCYFKESDTYLNINTKEFYDDINHYFEKAKNSESPIQYMYNSLYEKYSFITNKFINDFIEYNDYFIFQDKLYKGKITITMAVIIITEKYFPEGINISDNSQMNKFVELLNNDFKNQNIHCKNGRALSARIQDAMILYNKATYCSPKNINVPKDLLIEIADYINNQKNQLSYDEVYNTFEEQLLLHSNINTSIFLHGVLKYFENELEIKCSKCYVTGIHNKELSTKSYYFELADYLYQQAKPISISELLNKFPKFTSLDIGYAIQNYYTELVRWDKDIIINLNSIKLESKDKLKITEAINYIMNKNKHILSYASMYTLYKYMKAKKSIDLSKYYIENEKNLYQLVQYNFQNEFDFFRPHILKKGEFKSFNITDLIDIVLNNQKEIHKRDIYNELYKLYGGENNSLVLRGQKRISEKYFRTDVDTYCLKTLYPKTDSFKDELCNWITNHLIKEHIFLPNLQDYSVFENNKYIINSFSISDLIKHYSLPFIVTPPEGTIYSNNHDVIVNKSFKHHNKIDIFIWLCNKELNPPRTLDKLFAYAQTLKIFPVNMTKKEFTLRLENSSLVLQKD